MSANSKQVGGNHYNTGHEMQHWDWAWQQQYDQFQYCITKYVDRHKRKNGLEDLYKARHHLEKYIELLEEEKSKQILEDEYLNIVSTQGEEATEAYVNQD